MTEKQQRAELESAANAALSAAQQPEIQVKDLMDFNDEQLRFIASYWSQRPRVSNDEVIRRLKQHNA